MIPCAPLYCLNCGRDAIWNASWACQCRVAVKDGLGRMHYLRPIETSQWESLTTKDKPAEKKPNEIQ